VKRGRNDEYKQKEEMVEGGKEENQGKERLKGK
jgi:hypothetical protein